MKKKEKEDKTALNILEEAFHLLREIPFEGFFSYYIGTMPFLLGLIYFWNDMSKNTFAREYCLNASFGLVLLYVWMKIWQSVFSIRIYEIICNYRIHSWSLGSIFRMVVIQTLIHTSSIIVLPIAFLVTIPFGWTFAMYQMVLVHDFSPWIGVKALVKDSFQAARQFTFLNHMILIFLFIFGCIIFLNIGIMLYWMPSLAKSLFGIESVFTMGGFNLFNSTFILSVVCLTHLCIDPLIKTVFAMEKFYYRSRRTGEDLMADLGRFKSVSKIMTVILFLMIFIPAPLVCRADKQKTNICLDDPITIDADGLAAAIDRVMSQREFTWKMPKKEMEKQAHESGFFYKSITWVLSGIKTIYKSFGTLIDALFKWIEKLFPQAFKPLKHDEPKRRLNPNHLAAGMIVIVVALLCIVIWRIRKLKQKNKAEPATAQEAIPDIADESLLADRLPYDKWVDLAVALMEKGDLRHAVRALFLGTLAFLAHKNLIRIARHKSNREYRHELNRAAHALKEVVNDFDGSVKIIDRVWYGMHTIDQAGFDEFAAAQKRILNFAE